MYNNTQGEGNKIWRKAEEKFNECTTTAISNALHLSRNLTSQYLNGLLEKADQGVLFISNASSLGMECQKKIAEYLERRAYGNPGQKEKKLSRARLIFSVTPELHMHMNKELLTQIPVVCDIPSLQNRRPEEKEMLIMKFFRDEEEALKRDIQVSNQVFRALMDYLFQENISQLKNCIKVICANAFFRQENEKKMKVLLYHLPESMLAQTDLESLY